MKAEERTSVKCKDCGEEFYIQPSDACPECGCTEFYEVDTFTVTQEFLDSIGEDK